MEGGALEGGKGHCAISHRPKWRSPALPPSALVLGIVKGLRRLEKWGASPFLFQISEKPEQQGSLETHIIFTCLFKQLFLNTYQQALV